MGIRSVDLCGTIDLCGIVVMKMSCELSRIDLVSRIDLMSEVDLMSLMSKVNLMHGGDKVWWMSCYLVKVIEMMHRIVVKRISLLSLMLVNTHMMWGSIMNRTTRLVDSIGRVCVG